MATNKNIFGLNRTQTIEALRGHVRPDRFHGMLHWSTAALRGALAYHLSSDTDKRDHRRFAPTQHTITVDYSQPNRITVTRS